MSDTVKPYESGASKKQEVTSMFDTIAPRYDLLNHLLSAGIDRTWRRRLLKPMRRERASRILDIATGTGDLAIMEAAMMPQAEVTGVDISAGMLSVAAGKIRGRGLQGRITLREGDAENLPFEADSFDTVTAAFGVRNFENLTSGLSEMRRVLRPGGNIAILEFGEPRNRLFGRMYRFYFGSILPVIGGTISRDYSAYRYLPASVGKFPCGEDFMYYMRLVGFKNCHCRPLTGGIAYIYHGTK